MARPLPPFLETFLFPFAPRAAARGSFPGRRDGFGRGSKNLFTGTPPDPGPSRLTLPTAAAPGPQLDEILSQTEACSRPCPARCAQGAGGHLAWSALSFPSKAEDRFGLLPA